MGRLQRCCAGDGGGAREVSSSPPLYRQFIARPCALSYTTGVGGLLRHHLRIVWIRMNAGRMNAAARTLESPSVHQQELGDDARTMPRSARSQGRQLHTKVYKPREQEYNRVPLTAPMDGAPAPESSCYRRSCHRVLLPCYHSIPPSSSLEPEG